MGYSLCCLVGGGLHPDLRREQPGLFNLIFSIFGFPTGLTLCVVAGADLFTSNCMYVVLAVAEGKYGLWGVIRCLSTSYVSNLAGSLLLVALMAGGDVFYGVRDDFVLEIAHKKVSAGFGTMLLRGVLCNWLVCLAVWQASMARDLTGKFIGIFLPNSAFVAMGFEHCIANMFLIPMSMTLGSGISVGTFITRNLIPVTLGNMIGGALFVGGSYSMCFGTPSHATACAWDVGRGFVQEHAYAALRCYGHGRRKQQQGMGMAVAGSVGSSSSGGDGDGSGDVQVVGARDGSYGIA